MSENFEQKYHKDLTNLRSTRAIIRREAISNLGNSYVIEAIPYLVNALAREKNDELLSNIIWSIGKLPYLSAVEAILPYLQHPDFATRVTVVDALINVVVEANNDNITNRVYDELKKLAISNKEMQSIVVSRLVGFDRKDDEWFIDFLYHSINDPDFSVRSAAVLGLGTLNAQSAKQAIMNLLQNDPVPEVRLRAAEALGNLKAVEALDLLMEFYVDGNQTEREMAVSALGKLGSPKAIPIILETITDKDKTLQQAGISALLNTNDPEEVLKNFEALDKSEYNSVLNWLSSKKIPLENWLKLLNNPDVDEQGRSFIYEGLGLSKNPLVIDTLVKALTTPNVETRSSIAWALGELGSEKAIYPLLNLLQEDPSLKVKEQAARGLVLSGNSEALEGMINFLLSQNGYFPLDFLWFAVDQRSIPSLNKLLDYTIDNNEIITKIKNEAKKILQHIRLINTQKLN